MPKPKLFSKPVIFQNTKIEESKNSSTNPKMTDAKNVESFISNSNNDPQPEKPEQETKNDSNTSEV